MHRFFVKKENIQEKKVIIESKDFNHIKRVLRMQLGEKLEITCQGKLYLGEIEGILEDHILIDILEEKDLWDRPSTEIILFQGLAKGSKMDLIIQKGTEIGIKSFYAVSTHRSIVKINDEKKKNNRLKRWNSIAEEAAKQSKQISIAEVKDIISYKEIGRASCRERV